MILNFRDWLDRLLIVPKTRYDNYVTDHIDMIYSEYETKLLWLIWSSLVYYENQMGQWHDDRIGLIYIKTKTELWRPIWPDKICCENQTE